MRWRRLLDIGLVSWMLLTAITLYANWDYSSGIWHKPNVLGYVLICAAHLPLLLRERHPVAVLFAVSVASTVYLIIGYYHSVITFAVALCIFSVAQHRPRRISAACCLVGWSVLLFAQHLVEPGMEVFGVAVVTFLVAVAWAFGDGMGRLAQRGAQLAELTEQLRREQQERAHQAVSQEQSRIARELHDVVAHHMSVISVQAGMGRYVMRSDPDTAHAALDVIEGTAREALSEMRRMLAVLRVSAEAAPLDSSPGLAGLNDLIDRVRVAGATVEVAVDGTAATLPSGLDLCVYRVIQESLTNVLKHADPPEARVEFRWAPHEVAVAISDKGRSQPTPPDPGAVQHGLIGMRERARIYGGQLRAGPRPDSGFEVSLTLPIEERSR
jgi:signal transduction histidine kinase